MILTIEILQTVTPQLGIILPVAAGIATMAGGFAQANASKKINRDSMRFQEEMWKKTNKYNSPVEQRKRLQKAGLNPNLVYGGSSGQTAGEATQAGKPDFNVPEYSKIGDGAMVAINAANIKSNTDQNQALTERTKQETVNKGLEAVHQTIKNSSGAISLKQKRQLYDNTIKIAQERLENLSMDTTYKSDKNQRENRLVNVTTSKIRQEILNLKKQGKILSEKKIQARIDSNLLKQGLTRQDPMYIRIFSDIMANIMETVKGDIEGAKGEFKNLRSRALKNLRK